MIDLRRQSWQDEKLTLALNTLTAYSPISSRCHNCDQLLNCHTDEGRCLFSPGTQYVSHGGTVWAEVLDFLNAHKDIGAVSAHNLVNLFL